MFSVPTPKNMQSQSSPYDLQKRLDWGEPALTIIDAREREAFNTSHIRGAISLTEDELVERALDTLELNRDIYVYHASDEKTAEVANLLREVGYQKVSELTGGLEAWKAVGYPLEGNSDLIA
jgi:rhodanese-related sulfurtransferase